MNYENLIELRSPHVSLPPVVNLNISPESFWKQTEKEDLILAKLQIGMWHAVFPNRPYTPEGIHLMIAPKSENFETIQSIGKGQLQQLFTFLSPALDKPNIIIGYNEASDVGLPSAKSWKNLHLHIVSLPELHEDSIVVKEFKDLFEITDEKSHKKQLSDLYNMLQVRNNDFGSIHQDKLGINILLPYTQNYHQQLTRLLISIDQNYRKLTKDKGSYVTAIKRTNGNILLRVVPTTFIRGIHGNRFGLMEALGFYVNRFDEETVVDRTSLYSNTLLFVLDLLSNYLNQGTSNWDEWYSTKNHLPALREKEQEKRHKLMFQEISRFIDEDDIKTIIEVGIGTGKMAEVVRKFSSKQIQIVGVDISEKLLQQAKEDEPASYFVQADTFSLPFSNKDRQHTIVFHQGLIEHFSYENIIRMLREQLRVAKCVIFSVPSMNYIFPGGLRGDERLLSLNGWLTILQSAGLKAEGQYYGENEGEKYHILMRVTK